MIRCNVTPKIYFLEKKDCVYLIKCGFYLYLGLWKLRFKFIKFYLNDVKSIIKSGIMGVFGL